MCSRIGESTTTQISGFAVWWKNYMEFTHSEIRENITKNIYVGLTRSVLDSGCIEFGSAENTSLKRLDNIQNQALRLFSCAIWTTPTSALRVEMVEMPLELRKTQLSVNYWVNLKGHNEDHPTQDILKQCWEKERRETKSFG